VGLSPFMIVVAMVLVLLFLGCFVDQVSMLMITVPFFVRWPRPSTSACCGWACCTC